MVQPFEDAQEVQRQRRERGDREEHGQVCGALWGNHGVGQVSMTTVLVGVIASACDSKSLVLLLEGPRVQGLPRGR